MDSTINQPEETPAGPRLSAGMETARQLLAKILMPNGVEGALYPWTSHQGSAGCKWWVGKVTSAASTCLTTCYSCRQHTGGKNPAACLHLIPPCASRHLDPQHADTPASHTPHLHTASPFIIHSRPVRRCSPSQRAHLSAVSYIKAGFGHRWSGTICRQGLFLVCSDSPSMHSASLPNSSGSSLLPRSPRSEILRISGDSETFLIPRRPDKRGLRLEMLSRKEHRHCRSKH